MTSDPSRDIDVASWANRSSWLLRAELRTTFVGDRLAPLTIMIGAVVGRSIAPVATVLAVRATDDTTAACNRPASGIAALFLTDTGRGWD